MAKKAAKSKIAKSRANKTTGKKAGERRYSRSTSDEVGKELHRAKRGTARSSSGRKVKSRKQAIAIGLSKARRKGKKVPAKKR